MTGQERPFDVTLDLDRGRLHIVVRGSWDLSTVAQLDLAMNRVARRVQDAGLAAGTIFTLIDKREQPLQVQDVAQRMQANIAR